MNSPDLDPRSQELADRLARRAGSVDLGPPVVDVVIGRGHQRRQRRRAAVGIAAVTGICGASVVAIAALSRPSDNGSIVAAPSGTDEASAETPASSAPLATVVAPVDTTPVDPLELVPSPLVWNRVDPDSSEAVSLFWGGVDHGIAGDGPFVAWSTAPGRADDYHPTLWRSDDGQRWQQVATEPEFVARNVAERNGAFFTFGTSPATVTERKSDLSVGTSTDGGRTWTSAVLPLDTSALGAEEGVQGVGVNATSIATSPAGILLSAQVNAFADINAALPPEYRDSGWNIVDAGVEVFAGGECGTATTMVVGVASTVPAGSTPPTAVAGCEQVVFSWADLGISERAAQTIQHPEVLLFFSPDGATFEPIEAPTGFDADWTYARLTSFGDGFAALVNGPDGGASLITSADGRSWSDLGPVPLSWPDSIDEFGGRLVLSGWADGGYSRQVVAVREVDGTWTTTDLRSFLQPGDGVLPSIGVSHLAVGPSGITAVAFLTRDPVAEQGGLTVPLDGGITLAVADTSLSHEVYGPDGNLLGVVDQNQTSDSPLVASVPDEVYGVRWEVRTEVDGPVVATYSYEDLNAELTAAGAYEGRMQLLVLQSSDGRSWSRESLDELVGQTVSGSGGIRLTDSQVIVPANLADERNPDGTATQVLLVGTART
jgi:hypothetical protein